MANKIKKEKPIVFNLSLDAANADWIRALRLQKKADAGDKKAKAKLQKLFNTPMVDYAP